MEIRRPTWAEIDLSAIKHNIAVLRAYLKPSTRFMAVVKANAYGHGVMEVANVCAANGVDFLGVAILDEAMPLVEAGIKLPILVLGYVPGEFAEQVIEHDIRTVVYEEGYARELSRAAQRLGKDALIHFKIDTGMGRLGFPDDDAGIAAVVGIAALPGIRAEGLMTHFAESDSPQRDYTSQQIQRFMALNRELEQHALHIGI